MAYRLKIVRYHDTEKHILLQNENGPCPLLAAANALLLKGVIKIPPACIRNGVASIDDVVNMLADRALSAESEHHLHELMEIFPSLQYGMDVNPKFTAGPTGVEYTSNLVAFDLINVELVHGWLLDPQDEQSHKVVEGKTYNELVEMVVQGTEATAQVERLSSMIAKYEQKFRQNQEASGNEEKEKEEGARESTNTTTEEESNEKDEEGEKEVPNETVAQEQKDSTEETDVNEKSATNAKEHIVTVEEGTNESGVSPGEQGEIKTLEGDKTEEIGGGWSLVDKTAPESAQLNQQTEVIPQVVTAVLLGADDAKSSMASETKNNTDDTKRNEGNNKNCAVVEDEMKVLEKLKDPVEIKEKLNEIKKKYQQMSVLATEGHIINDFLSASSHQLTHHGLHELYNYLKEDSLCVFFRNNHFATMTKKNNVLYLLVTDLGYASVPEVVWEKLDGIDGDTDYVDSLFTKPQPRSELLPVGGPTLAPEQLLAQGGRNEADYQLALHLSKNGGKGGTPRDLDAEEGKLMAAATEASLIEYNSVPSSVSETTVDASHTQHSADNVSSVLEDADRAMALQLQHELDSQERNERIARQNRNPPSSRSRSSRSSSDADSSNCIIS